MKNIEMIINDIKTSEALQKQLAEAVKNNALAAFLKEQGCEATAEEFIAALKAPAGELGDEALDAVSGGANVDEAFLSALTLGVGCVVRTIVSAAGDGVGDGPNGNIRCNDEPTGDPYQYMG